MSDEKKIKFDETVAFLLSFKKKRNRISRLLKKKKL